MSSNGRRRKTLSVTIDPQVYQEFQSHCEANAINRSRLVEQLLADYLEEESGESDED